MKELIVEGVDRRYPAYVINPRSKTTPVEDKRVQLLLSETLAATSLAISHSNRGDGRFNLHIKSDKTEGVGLEGLIVRNPYDAIGGIGGIKNFQETIYANNGDFNLNVSIRNEDTKSLRVRVRSSELGRPTLVIGRHDIEAHGVISDLVEAKEADPFFGDVQLTQISFNELVNRVIRALPAKKFILID